jgi:hypothetical protein
MKKVYLIAVIVALIAGFATFLFANELSERSSFMDAKKNHSSYGYCRRSAERYHYCRQFATYFAEQNILIPTFSNGAITSDRMR